MYQNYIGPIFPLDRQAVLFDIFLVITMLCVCYVLQGTVSLKTGCWMDQLGMTFVQQGFVQTFKHTDTCKQGLSCWVHELSFGRISYF